MSFQGYLWTQFLGAVNDNMFRWLVVPIAKFRVGDDFGAAALAAGLACFVVPYLVFAPHAGWLADRFNKRSVTIGCKLAEIVIMLLGVIAIAIGNLWLLFAIVFLMGAQSALFSPAKLGIIPEIVRSGKISAANGWVGLTTVIAVVLGTVAGNYLYYLTGPDGLNGLWISALALLGVAVAGWGASLVIAPVEAANPALPFPRNPDQAIWRDLKLLGESRPILRVTLGIAFFWSLAALAQLNVDTYAIQELSLSQVEVGPLLGILSLGVGIGSVLAGLWSGNKVELGIVPLGAAIIAVSGILLSTTVDSYFWTAALLFCLGAGGGLFNVPLTAYLQHRSPKESLGAILAAGNFITFAGMLLVSVLFWMLQGQMHVSAPAIFLIAGLGTVPILAYVVFLLPGATMRFLVWLLSHTAYRVRVYGRENLPETGGALLVANHVSWIDGILLLITSSRPIRMLAYADYVNKPVLRWLAKIYSVIPIKATGGPKALIQSLKAARGAVLEGDLVCIFAEGQLTRTGQLLPFQKGLMRIVEGTGAPVVPIYLDGLWGSIFSFRGGKFFWKWPRRWPYPVSILFGKPLANPDHVEQVRAAVQTLGVEAVEKRKQRDLIPQRRFLRKCRRSLFRSKVADSTGVDLTGGKLLAGCLVMRKLLDRHVLATDEKMVGILLPPSVGATVTNAAVSISGRVAVNLNYTLSNEDVNYCIRRAELKHILTSRKFLEKRPFDLDAEVICLEDLREKATAADKALAASQAYLLPASALERMLGLTKIQPDDLLTIIFTSGSTGEPKGVMLSHQNVASNIEAVDQLFNIKSTDCLLGVLPFFHSFGYTAALWLTLTLDTKGVFHFNPLDARQVGKLCEKHGVTLLLATPTFLRTYLKRCEKHEMHRLDLVAVGAERMPLELAEAFRDKFGVMPIEGYGTTELSPVAAFNVPDHRAQLLEQIGTKPGTVGRPAPGTMAKVVDPATGQDLGTNQEGLLHIKGPNVMLGYLHSPEKTAEVIQDGWYNTGDMAKIDEDGFITITGRQSRFSKIGGEMVPHVRIEELLSRIVEDPDSGEPELRIAVTSVPDEKKGERLIVVHKPLKKSKEEILKELAATGIPNLWLPSSDCFLEVEDIPHLGTGKLDLRGLQELAKREFPAKCRDAKKSEQEAAPSPEQEEHASK